LNKNPAKGQRIMNATNIFIKAIDLIF